LLGGFLIRGFLVEPLLLGVFLLEDLAVECSLGEGDGRWNLGLRGLGFGGGCISPGSVSADRRVISILN